MYQRDVSRLDALLFDDDEKGLVRPVPAAALLAFPVEDLAYWGHVHAVYQYPTTELIEWLRGEIGDKKTIEIGAGNGSIGRALGITMTDSYVQVDPQARAYWSTAGQPTVKPGLDVLKYEASDAVRVLKPHTVIGAWITQKWRTGDAAGSIFGVNEEHILTRIERYILIGNEKAHSPAYKRIRNRPHKVLSFPWLVSRSFDQAANRIYVWSPL